LRSRTIGKEVINKNTSKNRIETIYQKGQGNTIDYFVKHILCIYPESIASSHVYLSALIVLNTKRHIFD
jgi:hypothetical protein